MREKNCRKENDQNTLKKETAYAKYIKPFLDRAIGLAGLLVLSPLYLLIALAIVVDDPGPVLFKQKRVGRKMNGEITYFSILKFRTMKVSTPHDVPTHLLSNPEQYITRVGKFLRKTSLDELPQIWNIAITHDISIIGPRPALWNQDDLVAEREKYGANDLFPGLTGLAQISGRDELEIPVKAKFDGMYADALCRSSFAGFAMDVKCFFGTITSVLRSDGVVEGGTGELEKEATDRKRYLILTNHSYMLWQFRRDFIEELLKKGEVVIGTPFVGHEDDFASLGCRMVETKLSRRSMNPLGELSLLFTYRRLLRKERPDMVVTYSIKPNIYAGFLCRTMHIPYCANVQGLGTAFQNRTTAAAATLLYRAALQDAQTVFFENASNANEFIHRRIVPKRQITLLPGAGVNLEYFTKQPWPSEENGLHFLYLGRIMKEKGVEELFSAARRLKAKYGEKVQFDLVGFFDDDYEETVKTLEQEGVVTFHGFQAEPRPFYAAAHCIVLPSYHEGMSNVLLEASATGRPIITSDIPGCREAVQQHSGFLVRKQDEESLYEAMERFVQLSANERAAMGEAARARMERYFDKRKVVAATIRAVEDL